MTVTTTEIMRHVYDSKGREVTITKVYDDGRTVRLDDERDVPISSLRSPNGFGYIDRMVREVKAANV